MPTSEELREVLINLENARKKEAQERQIAEALLNGLNAIVLADSSDDLFLKLIEILRQPLDFEEAFVLLIEENNSIRAVAGTSPEFTRVHWEMHDMFHRVLKGSPVVVFNTRLVGEWKFHPDELLEKAGSALHFSFSTAEKKAVFSCVHSSTAHFSQYHISLAKRFSVLASQVLQKMESQEKIAALEQKLKAEEKIAALNKKLVESEKKLSKKRKMEAIGLLAGGIAHDLNNILSGIVGYPDILLLDPEISLRNKDMIQQIQNAGLRASAIVNDLLTVTRGVASPKQVVNVNEIIDEFFNSPEYMKIIENPTAIQVSTRLDSDLLNIKASPVHIRKVFMNLISNAVDAVRNESNGVVLVTTENVCFEKPVKKYEEIKNGDYVLLTVFDNGKGISSKDIDKIFEPFYTKKTMGRSGTGLGLTIVWNTVHDHDGYIDVQTEDKGVFFRLYFPLTRDLVDQVPEDTLEKDFHGSGESVLVVDDQESQRTMLCKMLNHLGYSPDAVSSGEAAVKYIRHNPVDIIILDMLMEPGMNGRQTYEKILGINPDQKAIIASGYSKNEDVVMAQKSGAGQFIKKPFTLNKLSAALKDELNR